MVIEHVFRNLKLKEFEKTDPTKKSLETRILEMKWKIQYDIYIKEKSEFKENWVKAYVLVW